MSKKPCNKLKILSLSIALALSGCHHSDDRSIDNGSHVASPDWQDQIIYFLMVDRFNDGNSNLMIKARMNMILAQIKNLAGVICKGLMIN